MAFDDRCAEFGERLAMRFGLDLGVAMLAAP
jgi:hypothetical protein